MGSLLQKSPKFYKNISLFVYNFDFNLIFFGWLRFINLSVQTFQLLIVIYKRGNFVIVGDEQ